MSAIIPSGTSSSLSALAQLLNNSTSQTTTGNPQAGQPIAGDTSTTTLASDREPAAFVTLSDQAKAAGIARAKSDQAAAESLQAYVEAHRVNNADNGAKTAAANGLQSILETNVQPAGAQLPGAQIATSDSKLEAIAAQITTLASVNEPPPFQTFTPTKSLSNSVTIDGYTLTLDTNAGTQFYGFDLSGNGIEAFNRHFGPSAGAGGAGTVPPGVAIGGEYSINNNEAEDSITVTRNIATASSASISSSSGSASASSVSAQSSSITFLVDYATGQISVEETAVSVSAQSTQAASPGSTYSTLA
jgi:hypothetical protein